LSARSCRTFNTLKDQGCHFEHNYGHGVDNLATVLALLMLLAFTVDQMLPWLPATLSPSPRRAADEGQTLGKPTEFVQSATVSFNDRVMPTDGAAL
jgi:hypothetical protein